MLICFDKLNIIKLRALAILFYAHCNNRYYCFQKMASVCRMESRFKWLGVYVLFPPGSLQVLWPPIDFNLTAFFDFAEINWLRVLWHSYFISHLSITFSLSLFLYLCVCALFSLTSLHFDLQANVFVLRIKWIDSYAINIRLNWLIARNVHFWIYLLCSMIFLMLWHILNNSRNYLYQFQ